MVHVREIRFTNFRRFLNLRVPLGGPGVYLLLGTNGSGKSTVLAGLKWIRNGLINRDRLKSDLDAFGGYASTVTRSKIGQPIQIELVLSERLGQIKPPNVSFGEDVRDRFGAANPGAQGSRGFQRHSGDGAHNGRT